MENFLRSEDTVDRLRQSGLSFWYLAAMVSVSRVHTRHSFWWSIPAATCCFERPVPNLISNIAAGIKDGRIKVTRSCCAARVSIGEEPVSWNQNITSWWRLCFRLGQATSVRASRPSFAFAHWARGDNDSKCRVICMLRGAYKYGDQVQHEYGVF